MRRVSIFLIAFLLSFSLVLVGVGEKNRDVQNDRLDRIIARSPADKLIRPLKAIVEVYKKYKKITSLNVSNYTIEKYNEMAKKAGLPLRPKITKTEPENQKKPENIVKVSGRGVKIVKRRRIKFDPVLGGVDWIDPYTILNCNIELYGDLKILKNCNIKIRSVSDLGFKKIVSAEIPVSEIETVAEMNRVSRITPVLKREPNNDLGTRTSQASRLRLRSSSGLYTRGYTGQGTIVGVIDTGIDWSHGDFIDPRTGLSRILYLWDRDVTTPGRTPAALFGGNLSGLTYGTVWTNAEIDAGTCTSVDTHGHGTHVCGTAAGNGYDTGRYTGMAPRSDIIFVKGIANNPNEGILFVYELASILNRTCAVNMSYGPSTPIFYMVWYTPSYPGDGTSTDALQISGWNNTYGPGHIPVKSAGNHGHWNSMAAATPYPPVGNGYHTGSPLSANSTHTFVSPDYSTIIGPLGNNIFWTVEMGSWYESPMQVTFISPNGNTIGPMVHGTTGTALDSVGMDGGVWYDLTNPPASNGDYYGWFKLYDPWFFRYQPLPGNWQILVEPIGAGSGYFDMWCTEILWYYGGGNFWEPPWCYFSGQGTHANYINDEGASPFEICVGAWTTRNAWQSIVGPDYYNSYPYIGDICSFSAPGPARSRMIKPDITAAGMGIFSSASSFSGYWTANQNLVDVNGRHGIMQGTSMSAPMTTGGVAMILQKYPRFNVNNVRTWLRQNAYRGQYVNSRPNTSFGHGKLRLLNLNDPPVPDIQTSPLEVILDNAQTQVTFNGSGSSDPERFPLTYNWEIEAEVLNGSTASVRAPAAPSYNFNASGSMATLDPDPDVEARYRASLSVYDTIVNSERIYSVWVEAKFYPVYPPSSFSVERIENNFIFYKKYVNRLSWAANPENKSELENYKLYRKVKGADDSTYELIATLDITVFSYDDRGLDRDQLCTYKVTAVNKRGKESDPIVAGN